MRFDFFQRVHGLSVELKPLPARKCDLMPLIASFSRTGKRLAFSADAKKLVLAHDWLGNAREQPGLTDEALRAMISRIYGIELSRRSVTQYRADLGLTARGR